ncbi:radical SAM protein [uncultured Anaerovibrio sp.]|uniref:radical SAM protein n=1 Tax=uncultured Anaerovibrio sp. TaxID=361586 RepID=UPI0026111E58|nr:radical SAM protein [uncultured Anaerovibrio sp.]
MEKTKPDHWSTAYQNDRVKLIDAVPLDAPLCIIVEPTNVCNFKCLMCWQSTEDYKKDGGPFSNMDMKLFEKIIDDTKSMVEKYGKIKLIKLYSTGEPLLHPQIGEMVKTIKDANICVNLEITTNGS